MGEERQKKRTMNFAIDIVQHDPLLTTKLYTPRLRRNLVPRQRLVTRLDRGLERTLTLISAPAGFGKTTLVSQWLHQVDLPTAWLSLDEDDNEPGRFWQYFIAALKQIEPKFGQHAQELDRAESSLPVETLLTALINNLSAAPTDFVLVLDDFHLITATALHSALTFLLDHPPPQMHLIVTSRVDPPLPLARLRARDQLVELHTTDLRFTSAEAATFLNQVMGLSLSAADIAALETRTEGWITGLQLAALSLQECSDVPGFMATFTGSHRYIFDYLANEVLQQQPEPIQQFLLQTSILNRLTGPLCDAVLGRKAGEPGNAGEAEMSALLPSFTAPTPLNSSTSSQDVLAYLEQANLFIIPLDDERRWYRYNRLFADFLRGRLQHQVGGPGIAPLHHRAAAWYEQNGLVAEAMGHALAVADVERASRLVERSGRTLLRRSEMGIVQSWLQALPAELIRARPRLSLFHAWAMVLTGQLEKLEAQLQATQSALRPDESGTAAIADALHELNEIETQPDIPGELSAIEATLAYFRRDFPRAIEAFRQAFASLPEDNLFLRGAVAMSLGTACVISNDLEGAKTAFRHGQIISQASGNLDMALITSSNLAKLYIEQGQLRHAADIYRQALALVIEQAKQGTQSIVAGRVYVGLGEILYQQNRLSEATAYILQGIKGGEQSRQVTTLMRGYLALTRLKCVQNDLDAAFDMLRTAEEFGQENNLPSWNVLLTDCRIRLYLNQGNLETAVQWYQKNQPVVDSQSFDDSAGYPDDLRRLALITQARLQIAQASSGSSEKQEQLDEVLRLLIDLRQSFEKSGRLGPLLQVLVLQALAYQRYGDSTQAIHLLQKALALAEPEGYVRLFLDEGSVMADLLRLVVAQGPASAYVDTLLTAFEAHSASTRPSSARSQPLVEPLSERELEILGLIAVGKSNRQIADDLVLSVGTVKWHLNNIYGKLGVRSRTQAVAQARELNLLG
jgi:LuxR family maltose regulon positive regulatory protein